MKSGCSPTDSRISYLSLLRQSYSMFAYLNLGKWECFVEIASLPLSVGLHCFKILTFTVVQIVNVIWYQMMGVAERIPGFWSSPSPETDLPTFIGGAGLFLLSGPHCVLMTQLVRGLCLDGMDNCNVGKLLLWCLRHSMKSYTLVNIHGPLSISP